MKAYLFIDDDKIGEVNFSITDESMGGIGGELIAYDSYQKYQSKIQQNCDKKGVSNIKDFNYKIILEDNSELNPQGGVGVTDIIDFHEIYVESSGLDQSVLDKING